MNIGYVRELGGKLMPMCPIYVEGPTGKSQVFTAHIDTGFTGHLVLPTHAVEELELEPERAINAKFANSRVQEVHQYRAATFWNNERRDILVLATGDVPLVGMELLRGNTICFDATGRGHVDIEPLGSNPEQSAQR